MSHSWLAGGAEVAGVMDVRTQEELDLARSKTPVKLKEKNNKRMAACTRVDGAAQDDRKSAPGPV